MTPEELANYRGAIEDSIRSYDKKMHLLQNIDSYDIDGITSDKIAIIEEALLLFESDIATKRDALKQEIKRLDKLGTQQVTEVN